MSKTLYGGQAVIEGVMMRGKRSVACAVRAPDGGVIVISEALSSFIYSSRLAKIPFLRAVSIMWDTLVLGTRMLIFSANIAVAETAPTESSSSQPIDSRSQSAEVIPAGAAIGTVLVALVIGIGLFFVLPLFLAGLAEPTLLTLFENRETAILSENILEGLVRLAILIAYIWLIGLMPDVRRVFQYHGAEHKTIAAEEAGAPLQATEIQKFNKAHPRCGTGFLLTVVVISIFVFALLGKPPPLIRFASRIVLIPVIVALSYELIKFSSAHRHIFLFDWLVVRPSLALQSLTTREPDEKMVEVAVTALQRVKAEETVLSSG